MAQVTYRVVVTREDKSWLASVPEVHGAHTWARSLTGLDRYVREAIALVLDLPPKAEKNLELELEFHTGDDDFDATLTDVRRERQRLAAAERALADRTAALAEALVRQHQVSVRDTAKLLDLSPQRISQLVPQADPATWSAAPKRAG